MLKHIYLNNKKGIHINLLPLLKFKIIVLRPKKIGENTVKTRIRIRTNDKNKKIY